MEVIGWIMFALHVVLVCCGLTSAGPREAVAVAVAVDELLQSNTPDLPDELDGDQREANPMPPPSPAGVCPCGCGKVNCTCPHAMGVVGAKPCQPVSVAETARQRSAQRREESHPVVTLDVAAIDAIGEAARRKVIVYVADQNAGDGRCVYCEQMHSEWGDGHDMAAVIYLPRTQSGRKFSGLPMVHIPDCDMWFEGYWSFARLLVTLKAYPPKVPQAIGATNVGTIKGRDAIAKLFAQVKQARGESTLQFGAASVSIPDGMTCEVSLAPDSLRVRFVGKRPTVRVGTGWLSLGRPVAGLSIAPDRVAVSIDGFPDLSLTVE